MTLHQLRAHVLRNNDSSQSKLHNAQYLEHILLKKWVSWLPFLRVWETLKWRNSCDKEITPKVIVAIDDGGRNFLAREFTTTRESP